MKNILVALTVAALVTGCSSWSKKKDDGGGVVSETTAAGGSEKVESTAVNFAPTGSDSGSIQGLQTLHFEFDKSSLVETEMQKLNGNVEWMKAHPEVRMTIEGHCDERGSNEYNLGLGDRRANTVKQLMVKAGIKGDRVSTVSFGEEKPIDKGDSEEAMAKNRRANFVPIKK